MHQCRAARYGASSTPHTCSAPFTYYQGDAAVRREPGADLDAVARELEHSRQTWQCHAEPVPARAADGCHSRSRGRAADGVAERGAPAAHLALPAGHRGVPGGVLPGLDLGLSRRRPEPGLSVGTRPAGRAGGSLRPGARPASGWRRLDGSAAGPRRLFAGGPACRTAEHRGRRRPDAASCRELAGGGHRLGRARRARHGRLYRVRQTGGRSHHRDRRHGSRWRVSLRSLGVYRLRCVLPAADGHRQPRQRASSGAVAPIPGRRPRARRPHRVADVRHLCAGAVGLPTELADQLRGGAAAVQHRPRGGGRRPAAPRSGTGDAHRRSRDHRGGYCSAYPSPVDTDGADGDRRSTGPTDSG